MGNFIFYLLKGVINHHISMYQVFDEGEIDWTAGYSEFCAPIADGCPCAFWLDVDPLSGPEGSWDVSGRPRGDLKWQCASFGGVIVVVHVGF